MHQGTNGTRHQDLRASVAVTDGGQWQGFFDQVAAETGNVFTEAHLFFIDVTEAAAWWVADDAGHFETWSADA